MHDLENTLNNLCNSDLFELYKYRIEISQLQKTPSSVVNQFIDLHCKNSSKVALSFIPFHIVEEIARRWSKEKFNYV